MSLFKTPSLKIEDGIPIFCDTSDRYIANYEGIASDHLAAIAKGIENPFMNAELWASLEDSTRDDLARLVIPDSKVLDVGVGLGSLLMPLENIDRHGIDISFGYLKVAQANGINVALARIEELPYRDNSFDIAVCTDVLEHVIDLHLCSKENLRVIKPGGLLVVRLPYKETLASYLDDACPYEFVHLRSFDDVSLRLHFCKIFSCEYLEHSFSSNFFGDSDRLRIQLLRHTDLVRSLLQTIPSAGHALSPLVQTVQATQSDFQRAMYMYRDSHPADFEHLARGLVLPMVVNMVLRKPASAT